MISALGELASEICTILKEKSAQRPQEANFVSIFGAVESRPFCQIGTQQIGPINRNSICLQCFGNADMHVKDMFDDVFVEPNCSLFNTTAAAYFQLLVSKVGNRRGVSCLSPLLLQHLKP